MKSTSILLIIAATASAIPTLKPHVRRQNQIIPVVVGGPQDTFVPNSVVAAVGDIVQFQFSNGNHTVTQSTIDQACTPMASGVHSGHIPFQDGQTDVGTFNMPVTSTDPMFLYCATGPHCQEGQIMVINAANAKQVADYAKLSQATEKSTDGTDVVGGTAGKIALDQAAFTPAPPEDAAGGPPPPTAPPATEAPAGGNATAPAESTAAAESPAASTSAASSSAASAETSAAASTAAPAETSAAAEEPAAAGEPAALTPTVDLAAPAKASPTSFVFLA